jgi:hypothetical protein
MEPKGGTPQSPAAAKLTQRPKKLNMARHYLTLYPDTDTTKYLIF